MKEFVNKFLWFAVILNLIMFTVNMFRPAYGWAFVSFVSVLLPLGCIIFLSGAEERKEKEEQDFKKRMVINLYKQEMKLAHVGGYGKDKVIERIANYLQSDFNMTLPKYNKEELETIIRGE